MPPKPQKGVKAPAPAAAPAAKASKSSAKTGGKHANNSDQATASASADAGAASASHLSKKQVKQSKEGERQLHIQERDAMLNIPDDEYAYEDPMEEESRPSKPVLTDAFGNTISKAAHAKGKEDVKIDIMRAEAKARRQAKENAKLAEEQQKQQQKLAAAAAAGDTSLAVAAAAIDIDDTSAADGISGGHIPTKATRGAVIDIQVVRQKLADGAKLSHKETKLLQRSEAEAVAEATAKQESEDGLSKFDISVQGERGQGADGGTLSAVDVVVSSFSIRFCFI
jgi:hypothetical protein